MVDPVEALLDIEFEHPFLDSVGMRVEVLEQNFLSIVCRASRSKPVAPSMEGGFMGGF